VPTGIAIGNYVQITGTNGEGLRIRSDAGLNGEFKFLGYDSEVFVVMDSCGGILWRPMTMPATVGPPPISWRIFRRQRRSHHPYPHPRPSPSGRGEKD
jgi:hypothetical protein